MTSRRQEYKFLVDVNLPKRFSFFNHNNYFHVVDIDPKMTDQYLWQYALQNDLVILTKDSDFYNYFLISETSPKVIYFQLGNMTLKELHKYFDLHWHTIVEKLDPGSLIIVSKTEISILK
jgi:predicted nuclease of predicted toxin-antitoxin system